MSKCISCNDSFVGKSDKKFCSDQCRSTFHNKQKGKSVPFIRLVNSKLRRNRTLLMKVKKNNVRTVRKIILSNLGFDFDFITHFNLQAENKIYRYCYDLGYEDLNENEIRII